MAPCFLLWTFVLELAALSRPVSASGFPRSLLERRGNALSWTPCFGNATAYHTECAVFETPLDYANPAAGNASLAVIRYKASEEPYLGTLWMNPGGPGGSGVDTLVEYYGERISNITGGHYDIASWDPRGVGYSLPRVKCFQDRPEQMAFLKDSAIRPGGGFEVRGNFSNQADVDALLGSVEEVDSYLTALGDKCATMSGDTLKYVGTAATARDLIVMTDALDGVGAPVNYWGLSYGTVIGSYFVNMFPDRVGRVVLDGVTNPVTYSQTPAFKAWGDSIQDADKTLMAFAQACADAGTGVCAISGGKTASEVYQWIIDSFDVAYDAGKKGFNMNSSRLRGVLFGGLYEPRVWYSMAEFLVEQVMVSTGIVNTTQRLSKRLFPVFSSSSIQKIEAKLEERGSLIGLPRISRRDDPMKDELSPPYASKAITCSDAVDADYTTTDVLEEFIRVTQQVSVAFGPSWGAYGMYCHRWPARAVERYAGPWNHTLRNPIIVIGNTADPITPLRNAKFVADQLGGSAFLIEQQGSGHTSFAMHSSCTSQNLAAYFLSGQLPESNPKQCVTDQTMFSSSEHEDEDIAFIGNKTNSIPNTTGGNSNNSSSAKIVVLPRHALSFAVTVALILSL